MSVVKDAIIQNIRTATSAYMPRRDLTEFHRLMAEVTDCYDLLAGAFFARATVYKEVGATAEALKMFEKAAQMDISYHIKALAAGLITEQEDVGPNNLHVDKGVEGFHFFERNLEGKLSIFPTSIKIRDMADLEVWARNILAADRGDHQRFLDVGSNVVTMGSCFSSNLGRALKNRGCIVNSGFFQDDATNTYANRHFIDWIFDGDVNKFTHYFHYNYGEEKRRHFLNAMNVSDLIVVTCGVAPCFFHAATGEFAFFDSHRRELGFEHRDGAYVMRTTCVEENVANLTYIIDRIHAVRPEGRIVAAISPVPLSGTKEMPSAVIADCLSKSTIKLAVHQALQQRPEVIYWPSYEIVRWLGAYAHFPVFGGDDGHSRHVNAAVVDLIIKLFWERYARAPATADQPTGS